MEAVTAALVQLDPLFAELEVAAAFERRAAAFGSYRLYAEHEQIELAIGPGLSPRHDAVRNFLKTRVGRDDTAESVGARTSYFREEYAYGDRLLLDGVESLRDHPGLIEAARRIHGRDVIEPAIVYANLFLPGQELAVHTDVPEFRGLNRKLVPQWLLVVMHHSGCSTGGGSRSRRASPGSARPRAARSRTGRKVPTVRPRDSKPATTPPRCSTRTPSSMAWSRWGHPARSCRGSSWAPSSAPGRTDG